MDPILTPLITAAGVSGSFSIGAATISYASVISSLIVTAGVATLDLLLTEKPAGPDSGHFVVRQATPARQFAFGTVRLAGAVMLEEEYSGKLLYVAALCGHRISAVRQPYLNDDPVTVATGDWVQVQTDGRYGPTIMQLWFRLGLATETHYDTLATYLPTAYWPSNARGDGVASLAMMCGAVKSQDFGKVYPYAAPKPSVIADTALVWDPRVSAQDPANSATWAFSTNPALAFIWHKCFNPFGPKHDYTKAILPVLDWYIEAANVCDGLVPLKAGGTEKRYRMGGSWNTETGDDKTVTIKILAACDGWCLERGDGAILFRAGKYYAPTAILTLDDDAICGFSLRKGIADSDTVNRLYPRFTSPDAAYTIAETTAVNDLSDQAARGKVRAQPFQIEEVQSVGQISRLAWREMFRQKQKLRGTIDIQLHAIESAFDRFILLKSATVSRLNNVVIEVRGGRLMPAQNCMTIEFLGSGPGVDTYDPATQEGAAPPVPERPASLGPPQLANVGVVPEQLGVGTTTIQLAVTFDAPTSLGIVRTDLSYATQWRLTNTGGTPGDWTQTTYTQQPDLAAGRMTLLINAVPGGTKLDVEVASIATGGTFSTWSTLVTTDTSTAYVAPTPPTGLTSSGRTISCVAPNSANVTSVAFFIATVGDTFADATPIGGKVFGSANQTLSTTYSGAAGSFDLFAVAYNGDVGSTPEGPVTRTFV